MLELLHPDGSAGTSLVLGGNCPQTLLPESSIPSEQEIELFIVAPTAEECIKKGWLECAVASVNQRLSKNGVCYLLVPPHWRWKTIKLLSHAGLVMDTSFWHFPNWAASHYLIPLKQGPIEFAVHRIIPASSWKKTLAKKILNYNGLQEFLRVFWKPVGVSFRRAEALPLFQWLFQEHPGKAIVRRSWRGDHSAQILYAFSPSDAQPSAIIKTGSASSSSACIGREAKVLDLLTDGVRNAGARVPDVLRSQRIGQRSSLFLTPLHGQAVSDLLVSNPDLLSPLFTKIVRWLERWHITTKRVQQIDARQLEDAILIPLEKLAPYLQDGEGYLNWLSKQIRSVSATPLPVVATHNDLTMANVLMDDQIGVVDWETGSAESWPLIDFYYAVTDAARIAHGYRSWLEAFKSCYEPQGSFSQEVRGWDRQLRSAIGISEPYAELCFHACWLHHAANEHAVSGPREPRPFLQIVQWLALNRDASAGNQIKDM